VPPVVNASPLIFLSKGDHIGLLQTVGDSVIVPTAVADEIRRRGPEDITAQVLRETKWLQIKDAPNIPSEIQAWDLGPGESAVLSLAYPKLEREVIIDDLAGRRCAAALDIPVRGTLGVFLLAKKQGRIEQARPIVEELRRAGMYLSDEVVDSALSLVNE
jgi:predicted nucleic acid-binding protein